MASEGAAADCKREAPAPEDSGVVLDQDVETGGVESGNEGNAASPVVKYEDLVRGEKLGVGGFSVVFKCNWKTPGGPVTVAMKELMECHKEVFQKEVDNNHKLSKLKHPNIVQFYGSCMGGTHFYILTELAERGSLYDHIHLEANAKNPNMESSLLWAADITEGMCYLHDNNVVHRDLKSPNVLLTHEWKAKICDFGIACVMPDGSRTASRQAGTVCWMAPELIGVKGKQHFYKCCDVFSFGMTMWELTTHEIPFEGESAFVVMNAIVAGERPAIPKHIDRYIYQLIEHCWHMDRKKRPSFCDVQTSLKGKCPVKRLVTDSEVTEAPNTPPVPSQPPNKAPADGSPSNGSVATPLNSQTEQAPPPASGPEDETDTPGGTPSPQPEEGNDTNGDSQSAAGDETASLEQPAKEEQNIATPAIVSPGNGTVAVATPPPSALPEQAPPLTSGVGTGGVDTDSVAQVTAAPSTSQLTEQEQPSALAGVSLGTSSGSVAATPPSSELQPPSSAAVYQILMNTESGLTNTTNTSTHSLNALGAPAGVSPSNSAVATAPSTQTAKAQPQASVVADGDRMNTESFTEVTNNSSLQSLNMAGAAVPQTSSGRSTNAATTTRQPVQGLEQGLATADVSATSSAVAASTRSSTHTTVPDQPLQQSHSVEIVSRSSIPVRPKHPTNATAGVSPSNGSVPPSTGTPRSNIQSQTHGGFAEPRNDMGTNPLGNTQALQSQPQKRVENNGSVAAANITPLQPQTHGPGPGPGAAVSQSRSVKSTNAAASHPPVQVQHQRLVVNRDDLWELAALLDPMAANWELFLGQLPGFPHGQTKKISANVTKQREDPKSCFIRGLEILCDSKKSVTYGDIAAIMERPMLPNKPLARRIRRDYKGQYNTIVSSEEVRPLVDNYLHEVAASWKMFLRQLRMPGSDVDQIEGCGNYAMTCLSAGLEFWVNNANAPTYMQIAGVLRGNVVTNYPLARKVEEVAKDKCQGSAEVSYTDDTHTPPSPQRAGPGRWPVVNIMDQTPLNWEVANGFKWTNKQRAEKTFRPTEIFSDKWEGLGKQFGYAPAVLRGYDKECLGKNEGCFEKVIDRWLEDGSDNYAQTWSGLCEALKDVGGVSKYVASFEDAIRNKKHM